MLAASAPVGLSAKPSATQRAAASAVRFEDGMVFRSFVTALKVGLLSKALIICTTFTNPARGPLLRYFFPPDGFKWLMYSKRRLIVGNLGYLSTGGRGASQGEGV